MTTDEFMAKWAQHVAPLGLEKQLEKDLEAVLEAQKRFIDGEWEHMQE